MKNLTYYVDIDESFPAAHQLIGMDSPCARLHGHNWKVRIKFSSKTLNEQGFIADFYEIRKWLRALIIEPLDHQFLNELPQFQQRSPTCEHIVSWMFETLSHSIDEHFPSLSLVSIRLWETEDFALTLSADDRGGL